MSQSTVYVECLVKNGNTYLESDGHSYRCPLCGDHDRLNEYYENHRLAVDDSDKAEKES